MAGFIDNPQKIGVGAVQSFGLARMIADIQLIDPSWFYTWTPALPEISVNDWATGDSVQLGGTDADPHLVLDSSSDAWILQDIPVTPGSSYDLSLVTGGSLDAAGGISVSFHDDKGITLSNGWLPLTSSGVASLDNLVAPLGTARAKLIAWGEAGTLEIDDVTLSRSNTDAVRNGGFQSGTSLGADHWLAGGDASLGRNDGDQHYVLKGSPDGWILQDVSAVAGGSYALSVTAGGGTNAVGGISVDFLADDGTQLLKGWMPLNADSGTVTLNDIVAPAGTAKARIVAWGETGALEIDDIRLSPSDADVVRNGGFQHATSTSAVDLSADYVPMVWGRDDVEATNLNALKGQQVILGFNEPDHSSQSRMSVDEAIKLWPELMATGARLGSPATTTPGTLGEQSWLGRFMKRADDADLRVDFIAVHYYSANKDVGAFETFLNKTYAAYDRPIWITEWALVDWNNPSRFSSEETAKFFSDAVQMLDDLPFVERHAWFGLYDGMDGLNINTHLIDGNGILTPVGEALVDLAADHDIHGTAQADSLMGGADGDTLFGYGGDDTLDGGLGNDVLHGGDGLDRAVFGGSAADYGIVAEGAGYRMTGLDGSDMLVEIEELAFSSGEVVSLDAFLSGNFPSNNQVQPSVYTADDPDGGGMIISSINPSSAAGKAAGAVKGSHAAYSVYENGASAETGHTIDANAGYDEYHGGSGNDRMMGRDETNIFRGGDGRDYIYGNAGADLLDGGNDRDTIVGGKDDDILIGGDGADTFNFAAGDGSDQILDLENVDRLSLKSYFKNGETLADAISVGSDHLRISNGTDEIKLMGLGEDDIYWLSDIIVL